MTSTHDTDTLTDWWDNSSVHERSALLRLPLIAARGFGDPGQSWTPALGDAILELAWSAASEELFATVQDLFGWRDRINVPATVGEHNWTWRLPWAVDRLLDTPEAIERARFCRDLTRAHRAR
jgi:4-alpha-glucanotransferase